ncbi:T7SS effector LXG polymorphic toxin [Companilactobacillus sp. DQM5]|uniref:T7SS effector LXG polymorphic toxin n=1 Tax=Companilactobacillus sp. DQM5 TaxID=3463359 RepID=UPI004059B77D
MGLRYVIDSAEEQSESSIRYCNKIIEAMDSSIKALNKFVNDEELQGKTYSSAKNFVRQIHIPLAKGIVEVCEEVIKKNKHYVSKYRSDVATVTVDEDRENQHISKVQRQISNTRALNDALPNPMSKSSIEIYQEIEKQLKKKIQDLYDYDSETHNSFESVENLLSSLSRGFQQLSAHSGFNPKTGTFSTEGMDLSWTKSINDNWKSSKEEQIEELEKNFGISKEIAKLIIKMQNKVHDYAKKHHMNQDEENHFYFSLLASAAGYQGNFVWGTAANNPGTNDLEKILKNMGFSNHEINKMITNKDKEYYPYVSKKYDFGHLMACLSVITNNNSGKTIADIGTTSTFSFLNTDNETINRTSRGSYDRIDEAATFRGDIASGSFDRKDYMADVDSLNLKKRGPGKGNVLDILNKYFASLSNGTNRANELAKNYGGKNNLHNRVFDSIDDAGNLKLAFNKWKYNLSHKDKLDKKNNDMWNYFLKDFNK